MLDLRPDAARVTWTFRIPVGARRAGVRAGLYGLGMVLVRAALWPALSRLLAHDRLHRVVGDVRSRAVGIHRWHIPITALVVGAAGRLEFVARPLSAGGGRCTCSVSSSCWPEHGSWRASPSWASDPARGAWLSDPAARVEHAKETAWLPVDGRRRVDELLAPRLTGSGDRALAAHARALAQAWDPHQAVRHLRRATEERRVSIRPAPDTMV